MLRSTLLAGLLIFAAPLAMSVSADASQKHDEQPVIQNRAQLEAHLASAGDSPLFHLSEPGRRSFIEGLRFGDDYVFPVDRTAVALELNDRQTREVLALFGVDWPDDGTEPENRVPVAESDLLDDYYRYVDELREVYQAAPSGRDPKARRDMLALFDGTFGSRIQPGVLETQTPADLRILHAAIEHIFFYTHEPALLSHSVNVVSAFEEKIRGSGYESSRLAEETYRQLVVAREFDRAEAFARAFEVARFDWELASQGSLAEGTPAMLVPVENGDDVALHPTPVPLDSDVQVIAMVGPGCSFSQAAVEHVEKDDELRAMLAGRTTWLTHQKATNYLDPVLEWNRKARETRMNIIYRDRDWPVAFDFSSTPIFYILKNGELKEKIRGWPDDSQAEKLKDALRAVASAESADD